MKILIVNKFLYPNGGSETYIFKLGEELVRQGHEVQYFGMEHEGRIVGNHAEQYTRDMNFHTRGIEKILYPFKIIYSREAARKITMVLNDFKPNVVHLNNFNFQLTPSIIYATRKWEKKTGNKVKIIYTAHDYQWVCPNHLMMIPSTTEVCFQCRGGKYFNCIRNKCIHNSRIKSFLGAFEASVYRIRRSYGQVDKVICPSEFLAEKLGTIDEIKEKLVVRHNFIENSPTINGDSRRYVLYFGRYSSEKGVNTLLDVCRKLDNIPFVFAGNGELLSNISKVRNICNYGFLTGEELNKCIANALFVIFPSKCSENCPFSVMEALSMGIPVIASDIGGVPELVKDKKNGLLFAPGNPDALEKCIRKLWNDRQLLNCLSYGAGNTKFSTLEEYTKELLSCL